ncbi:MAG: 1-acyl-sn-glycerol-3-phosphate acyltransferase [Acidimicrobiia bacterium]|nr:1-acyl-sn-glycerol-3-phosphate acyltransferase [Acidimicrobiia bacterium]
MLRKTRDWVFTVPLLLLFGVTLLVHDVVGRLALLFGQRPFERVMASLQRSIVSIYRVAGTSVSVERSPLLEPNTGYLIVSNHQSLFDIAIIGGLLFTNYPKYVAKKELANWIPSVSLNLKRGGNALIDRDDRRQSLRAIKRMAENAQSRGVSVVIFPEGTRSRDGELGEFRRAGSITLMKAADQLAIVPAAVDGAWRLLVDNMMPVPFGTQVRVYFGDPIDRTPDEDLDATLDRVRQEIAATLHRWRSTAG